MHADWGTLIVLGGCLMAFGFNLSNYYFVRTTSALTSSIGGNAVKIITLIVATITDNISSAQNICGVVLASTMITLYTYLSHAKPPCCKLPPPAKGGMKGGLLGDEATPLTTGETSGSQMCCVVS